MLLDRPSSVNSPVCCAASTELTSAFPPVLSAMPPHPPSPSGGAQPHRTRECTRAAGKYPCSRNSTMLVAFPRRFDSLLPLGPKRSGRCAQAGLVHPSAWYRSSCFGVEGSHSSPRSTVVISLQRVANLRGIISVQASSYTDDACGNTWANEIETWSSGPKERLAQFSVLLILTLRGHQRPRPGDMTESHLF